MATFYSWIKLKLSNEVFLNLPNDYPDLLQMVFGELKSDDLDSLEVASDCIVELL